MKTILLILAFGLIIAVGILYNVNSPEIKPYKVYLWIPIAVSFGLFSLIFLQKDSGSRERREKTE